MEEILNFTILVSSIIQNLLKDSFSQHFLGQGENHMKEIPGEIQTASSRFWTWVAVSISKSDPIYQPLHSGRIWHKVIF